MTVNSTLKSAEALLTKKYRSIKPNTQQLKKTLDKTLDGKTSGKEDEKLTKKEINSMEVDTPIVDTSEIGCVIFIYLYLVMVAYHNSIVNVLHRLYYPSIAVYDNDDYLEEEESDATEMSLGQMLESHATSEGDFCDDSYEYE